MAMYSIYKTIRNDKPLKRNDKYPAYLQIREGDKIMKVSANMDVRKELWNVKKREPKG